MTDDQLKEYLEAMESRVLARLEASERSQANTERLKWIFGFLLVFILGGLSAAIAVGHVEEKTSYGLPLVLIAVSNLATQFGASAFPKLGENIRGALTKEEPPKQEIA